MEKILSPKQVAEALRVSESSIKRWCDQGVIPTVKTVGGHRRIPIAGLLAFLESTDREIVDLSAIGIDTLPERRGVGTAVKPTFEDGQRQDFLEAFEAALVRGDERECRAILIDYYDRQGSFATMADDLIAKAFHSIGDAWHRGEVEIFQERRACELCTRLLHELRRLFPEPQSTSPFAMGGSPSGDYYSLPGQLVEVALREAGWRATNLGVNLPLRTIAEAARRERPNLLWLSVAHLQDRESFLEEYEVFWSILPKDTVLVVGGRELKDSFRPQLKYTAHCDTLQQLSHFVRSIRGSSGTIRASNPI